MKNTTRTRQHSNVIVTDGVGTDILQGTAVGVGAMAIGLVGAWALSCLVAGVIVAGGPLNLAASWFNAISGM
ncbi:MAG: hypothetical protein OEY01_06920 [Desulfobulbaceae bacterium]|nr:hypothetical protein [Desulfobulbaceae bacterium]HIJ78789.1 hypothetical protein [Deltaproteobacteria bacterium]